MKTPSRGRAVCILAWAFLSIGFPVSGYAAVRFDVVAAPTEVINTGRSEVTGSINLIVRGVNNITGTPTGGAAQIAMLYVSPRLQLDNTTTNGVRLFSGAGFAPAGPAIIRIENRDLHGGCAGAIEINLLPGAAPTEGDFIRIEGVRGRIDASAALTPGTDLYVDLLSANGPAANTFSQDRIRVAKSFDGLGVEIVSDELSYAIRLSEGFARAFVDDDANNDGINFNDRTDSGRASLGSPTHSTQFLVRLRGIPDGISSVTWPAVSTAARSGAALYLVSSTFGKEGAVATYRFESVNQTGESDLQIERFDVSPKFVFTAGRCDMEAVTASVTLAPAVVAETKCEAPSTSSSSPRFLEVYELLADSLSPSSAVAGAAGFDLKIRGAGFVSGSRVLWNGSSRSTTYKDSTELTAAITAVDIASTGTATVTVENPASAGGGESNSKLFKILQPAVTLYYPRLVSFGGSGDEGGRTEYTGFALANTGGRIATLKLSALDSRGDRFRGLDIVNPAVLTLKAGEQVAILDSELFGSGFSSQRRSGWLKLEGDAPEVAGIFLSFDGSLASLDGAEASSRTVDRFVFPEIRSEGWTQIHIANPNTEAARITLELLNGEGTPRAGAVNRTVEPNGVLVESLSDLFPEVAPVESDYVRVAADPGVVGYQTFGRLGGDFDGLNGQDARSGATTLYSPQYVVGGSVWRSELSVINLDAVPGTVTFRFLSDDGVPIGSTRIVSVAGRGKIRVSEQDFFGAIGAERQGYLEIVSSGIKLAGSVVFGNPTGAPSTALPLVSTLEHRVVLCQVASGSDYYMGISILNPGDDSANAVIQVFDRSGRVIASKIERVPARRRSSRLLTELFPELAGREIRSGYVLIDVNRKVASMVLFGGVSGSVLSAVPAQPIP